MAKLRGLKLAFTTSKFLFLAERGQGPTYMLTRYLIFCTSQIKNHDAQIYAYDAESDTWTEMAKMVQVRGWHAITEANLTAVCLGNRKYYVGETLATAKNVEGRWCVSSCDNFCIKLLHLFVRLLHHLQNG